MKQIYFTILFVFSSLLFAQQDDPYRLPHGIEPTFQFIHLNLDPDKEGYSGSTKINLDIKEAVDTFRLHGRDFKITKIVLSNGSKSFKVDFEFQQFGLLKIAPNSKLSSGRYVLEFEFEGKVSKKGEGISWFEKDSLNYLYTQMQDIFARMYFPCFDEPNFKFPYQIEITAPKENLIVSNTPEEKLLVKGELKTVLFKTTKPIPSYLIAFAVGPYETTPIPGLSVPGRIILPRGYLEKSRFIKKNTAKILRSLEDYFGMPYPYEKLDFIGVGNLIPVAMENPGLVVYDDVYLIEDDNISSIVKYFYTNVTAHELAHMWFGNLVTVYWWDDIWLNEGFASWIADEIVYKDFPDLNALDGMYDNFKRAVDDDIIDSAPAIIRPIKGSEIPLEAFDNLTYRKSQVVLRMLESWVGRDNFRSGLKSYFEKHKWKNAVSNDLFMALSGVTDRPIKEFIQAFVTVPGIPMVNAKINGNTISIFQKRLKTVENPQDYGTVWPIPMNLMISDGKQVFKRQIILDKTKDSFVFDDIEKIEWLHLKENVNGYYTWLTSQENALKAIQSGTLSATEIEDMCNGILYALGAGKIGPVEILKLADKLKTTKDPAVIVGLTALINNVYESYAEEVPHSLIRPYINNTMTLMLEELGMEANLSFSSSLRSTQSTLIRLLYMNLEVREKILSLANAYLNENSFYNYWTYLTAFGFFGGEKQYKIIKSHLENAGSTLDQQILAYTLAMFPEEFSEQTLEYCLKQDRNSFLYIYIPRTLQVNLHRRKYLFNETTKINVFQWVKDNEDFIRKNVAEWRLDNSLPLMINDRSSLDRFNEVFPESTRSKILNQKIASREAMIKRREKQCELYTDGLIEYLNNFNKTNNAKN